MDLRRRAARVLPWQVIALAAAHVALLLMVADRYGFHRDELYFLEAGRHLAWGYVDQPPLAPFLARIQVELFGSSVAAIRVIPAMTSGVTVLLAALLARELGGRQAAQVAASVAIGGATFVLITGHTLSTATFDFALWIGLLLIGTRMLRTGDPRWWLAIGTLAGVGLWNKHLLVLLVGAFVSALVIERRWDLLSPRLLLAGGTLALLVASPTIAWQALNGWPQFEMARALSQRVGPESRALLLPMQLVMLGPVLPPLILEGARRLWSNEAIGRAFRPLLWTYAIAVVLTFVTGGRPYYPLPLAAVLVVAGAVAVAAAPPRRRWLFGIAAANALASIPIALPVLPVDLLARTPLPHLNSTLAETVGWPELALTVADVVETLPPAERRQVVLLTGSYGEAGALDRYGRELGLNRPYSGHNSYWHWRRPTDHDAPVVVVRLPADFLDAQFDSCELAATIDNGVGLDNEAQDQPVWVCRGLKGTWAERWPDFRHYS